MDLERQKQQTRKKEKVLKKFIQTTVKINNEEKILKFPNVEYRKINALSRKLLSLNYSYISPNVAVQSKVRAKYDWKVWYKTLFNLQHSDCALKSASQKGHYWHMSLTHHRMEPDILAQKLRAFGIHEDRVIEVVNTMCFKNWALVSDVCQRTIFGATVYQVPQVIFATRYSTDITLLPTSAEDGTEISCNNEIEFVDNPDEYIQNDNNDNQLVPLSPSGTATPPQLSTLSDYFETNPFLKVDVENLEEDPEIAEQRTEEWQMANWIRPLQLEFFKPEINEIWYSRRMYGKSTRINAPNQLTPPLVEILLESLRLAYFKQDWHIVAKCIEGLAIEASSPAGLAFTRHWIMWNTGLYSILRFEKSVDQAAVAVQNFARSFHGMYKPHCYPRRLGVEVAIWLTQEGRFLEGLQFLEEMDELGRKSRQNKKHIIIDQFNPKRDLVNFLTQLIRAVYTYAVYKRDQKLSARGLFEGNDDDLIRSAEIALSSFENLLELSSRCEGEITSYLNQIIELTVKCRSPEKAKELFDEIIVQYYGNAAVERAYLKFLSKYFKDQKSSICKKLKLKRKFKFIDPPHWHHQGRAIATYRKRRENELRESSKLYFNKLPNPGFSV